MRQIIEYENYVSENNATSILNTIETVLIALKTRGLNFDEWLSQLPDDEKRRIANINDIYVFMSSNFELFGDLRNIMKNYFSNFLDIYDPFKFGIVARNYQDYMNRCLLNDQENKKAM